MVSLFLHVPPTLNRFPARTDLAANRFISFLIFTFIFYTHSSAGLSRITLLSIPSELFERHIFSSFDLGSLVACILSCSKFHRIIGRLRISAPSQHTCLLQIDTHVYHNRHTQVYCNRHIDLLAKHETILKNLFRYGSVNLLLWFYKLLQYPHIKSLNKLSSRNTPFVAFSWGSIYIPLHPF